MRKLISVCLSLFCFMSVITPVAGAYKAQPDEKTNWYNANGKWYVLDEDFNKMTGWYRDKHLCWYFLDYSTGLMKTGWAADGTEWYYLNPDNGIMQTGWQTIDGAKYYFETSGSRAGAMVTGNYQIDDVIYTFDANGVYQGEKVLNETELKLMEYQQKAATILSETDAIAISSDILMYLYAGFDVFDMAIDMDVVMNVKKDPKMSMEMTMSSMDEEYSMAYYLKGDKFYYTDGNVKQYIDLSELPDTETKEMETVEMEPITLPQYTNLQMFEEDDLIIFTFDSLDLDFNNLLANIDLDDAAGLMEPFELTLQLCQGAIAYEEDGTPVSIEYYMVGECLIDGISVLMEMGVTQTYDVLGRARVKYPSFSGFEEVVQ